MECLPHQPAISASNPHEPSPPSFSDVGGGVGPPALLRFSPKPFFAFLSQAPSAAFSPPLWSTLPRWPSSHWAESKGCPASMPRARWCRDPPCRCLGGRIIASWMGRAWRDCPTIGRHCWRIRPGGCFICGEEGMRVWRSRPAGCCGCGEEGNLQGLSSRTGLFAYFLYGVDTSGLLTGVTNGGCRCSSLGHYILINPTTAVVVPFTVVSFTVVPGFTDSDTVILSIQESYSHRN